MFRKRNINIKWLRAQPFQSEMMENYDYDTSSIGVDTDFEEKI